MSGLILGAALAACGDPDPVDPIAGPSGSTVSGTPLAPGETPAPGTQPSGTVQPLQTKAGAPSVCNELRQTKLAETMTAALGELANPDTAAAGKARVQGAVTTLSTLAGKAEDPLKGALSKLGTSLTALAQKGMNDTASVEAAGTAAFELDDQVLNTCGFPLSDA